MSNCMKKGTQILVEENDDMTHFKIYEGIDGKMVLLGEFNSPMEVEEFFHKLEEERPNDDIVLRFI